MTPQAGPSGLCRATRGTATPTGRHRGMRRTPPVRGRRKKLYTPKTGRILKKWKADAHRYRRALSQLRKHKSPRKVTKRDAMETLKTCLTPEFYKLLNNQVMLHGRKMKGRRWSQEMKEFALGTFFHSPAAYRHLSKVLALPTSRSLRKWLSEVPMTTGIIPKVLDVLKEATTDWPLADRACVIMFDEMSLQQNLQYDTKNDIVMGFSDNGTERTPSVANQAFVVLLSGISKPWVQPLAFAVARTKLHAPDIRKLLFALIEQLSTIQLFVKAVVCDQGTSNVTLSEQLNVTPDEPFFEVGGHKVYFLFDTPHLIKCTRNNLRAPHKLFIGTNIVEWKYIVELYESSDSIGMKLARKLTDNHIYKRPFNSMKVKFATEALSESVSVALTVMIALGKMDGTAKSTAEFIERIDKLFDCFNSKNVTARQLGKMDFAITAESGHVEFLREAVKWIKCWRFDSPRQPHTIRGWLVTIQAVLLLWEDLSQNFGFTFLLTRHLQQDPLENLFGTVRRKHGCNEHPNVFQFVAALKHISFGKLSSLMSRGNCEIGDTYLLAKVMDGGSAAPPLIAEESEVPSSCDTSGGDLLDIEEQNALYCFTSHLVQQFLKKRPAECVCGRFLRHEEEALLGSHQFLAMLQAHGEPGGLFGDLTQPSERLFEAVKDIEKGFLEYIGVVAHLPRVVSVLEEKLCDSLSRALFCSGGCRTDFLQQFCRARLLLHIRHVNRVLRRQKQNKSSAKRKLQKLQK